MGDDCVERPRAALARVLCVDDDSAQLEALRLTLGHRYVVHTSSSAEAALSMLTTDGPFHVVVSDNNMPRMSGAEFLQLARERHRDTIRILLTGHSDIAAAIDVVNRSNLFRFLVKPCPRETLFEALDAAVEQHELQVAERQLLQQTLLGSIRALLEVMGAVDPVSFGRVSRLRELCVAVADRVGLADRWQLEYAALMSQLGYVCLPEGTLKRVHSGVPLNEIESKYVARAAALTSQIISHIPRLGKVGDTLKGLAPDEPGKHGMLTQAALILKTVSAFEALERGTIARGKAIAAFTARTSLFDTTIANALLDFVGEEFEDGEILEVPFERLAVGMTVVDDVYTRTGALLMPRGTRITDALAARIEHVAAGTGPAAVRVLLAAA